ncbi:MAG: hypothetical protein NTW16_09770 [Bacteroidetes bacterium]|nr:hypothetical protein [Bacteroidota bacterium]
MKKKLTNIFLGITFLWVSVASCKKDENPAPPSIQLLTGMEYTASGAIVATGGKLRFGISASATGANITNFVIKKMMPDGSVKVVLDSGLNSTGFTVNETFYQGVEDTVHWTFQLMDKNRQFATTAITLYRDPASTWGGILEYPAVVMGFQNSATHGQFLVPSSGKIYFADSAVINQSLIDIIPYYYVDGTPSPTFSSAGETGGGITEYYPTISAWTTKNYTKWDISVDTDPVPVSAFDACHNDSLLIVSYDDVWGKRKFKWAEAGIVIPFLTSSGKRGLIRVISVENDPAGAITFAMKIQQ